MKVQKRSAGSCEADAAPSQEIRISVAESLGETSALDWDACAKRNPSTKPTPIVAVTPQHKANSVGLETGKSGGCASVKYSMHNRAVT